MVTTMDKYQAAKVLRAFNEWRLDNDGKIDQPPAAQIRLAIDAAVAALEVAAVPVAWRYQDANDNYRYRKYVAGFDVEYKSLRPVPLYAAPQPAYCCAKCGIAEMATKPDDQRCGSCNDIHDTLTPCNNDHEDDAA